MFYTGSAPSTSTDSLQTETVDLTVDSDSEVDILPTPIPGRPDTQADVRNLVAYDYSSDSADEASSLPLDEVSLESEPGTPATNTLAQTPTSKSFNFFGMVFPCTVAHFIENRSCLIMVS